MRLYSQSSGCQSPPVQIPAPNLKTKAKSPIAHNIFVGEVTRKRFGIECEPFNRFAAGPWMRARGQAFGYLERETPSAFKIIKTSARICP